MESHTKEGGIKYTAQSEREGFYLKVCSREDQGTTRGIGVCFNVSVGITEAQVVSLRETEG